MLTEEDKSRLAATIKAMYGKEFAVLAKACGIECADIGICDECAQRIVDALERRMLPEGVEWSRFEDGEPVRIGDRVQLRDGREEELYQVHMFERGCSLLTETSDEYYPYGAPVRRPEPEDTQERIDGDAEKSTCAYFGWNGIPCREKGGCPAYGDTDCDVMKTLDLLRRQRAFDARKDGAR